MAEYTYGKDFAIRTETDCIATEDDFGQYVGRIAAVKINTNGDRIRSMTDEELANAIVESYGVGAICPLNHTHIFCVLDNGCKSCWLDWLRKKAEDGRT